MPITRVALFGLLSLACITPALAQQPAPAHPPVYAPPASQAPIMLAAPVSDDSVPPQKAAAIRHLLTLMGTAKLSQQVMRQMMDAMQIAMPQVPAVFWTKARASMTSDDFINLLIPIYSRHYSQTEIDGLVAFYQSPLGQKYVAELPHVQQESMAAGQQWGQQKAQEIQTQIMQEQANDTSKTTRQ